MSFSDHVPGEEVCMSSQISVEVRAWLAYSLINAFGLCGALSQCSTVERRTYEGQKKERFKWPLWEVGQKSQEPQDFPHRVKPKVKEEHVREESKKSCV